MAIPFQDQIKNNKVDNKSLNTNSRIKQDVEELNNSSFTYKKNVKRYDELQKTKYLLYFKKDNSYKKIYEQKKGTTYLSHIGTQAVGSSTDNNISQSNNNVKSDKKLLTKKNISKITKF